MGGTSCHYSSANPASNGCTSFPNNSVLSAGAIVGIVIASLIGIGLIILLGILISKVSKRNPSLPHQHYHPNVYSVPVDMRHDQRSTRKSEMYTLPKSPIYSEAPINSAYYNNV